MHAPPDLIVRGLALDSRKAEEGFLFFALPGEKEDGGEFIAEAKARGAACAVCEHPPETEIPYILVPDAHKALALCAAVWYGTPAGKLRLVGVTGTNGKTTTTYLIKQLLEKTLCVKVGLIGTNQNLIGDKVVPTDRTTPDALPYLTAAKNVEMLTRHKVYSGSELKSRCEINLDNYRKTVHIEAKTMLDMARREILPAVTAYADTLALGVNARRAAVGASVGGYEARQIEKLSALSEKIDAAAEELETALNTCFNAAKTGKEIAFGKLMEQLKGENYENVLFTLKRLDHLLDSALPGDSAARPTLEKLLAAAQTPEDVSARFDPRLEKLLSQQKAQKHNRTQEIVIQINQRLEQGFRDTGIGAQSIAEEMGVSAAYLRKQYLTEAGISIGDKLNQLRMDEAGRLLLETDQPIESIARQIGVENTKYFFVLFKKFKGMTPRQFRCKAETSPL